MIKQREARHEQAESVRELVMIQIPNSLPGLGDTPKLVQFIKSKLKVALINTESKYRYRQHRRRVHILDFHIQRHKPLRAWSRSLSRKCELANHTSVGRPHAILSSTEETRAYQPKQPFRNFYPNRQKEVEWYSFPWWGQREDSRIQNLEKGNKFGATSWLCRSGMRWCSSLEIDGSKAATRVWERRQTCFLWLWLVWLYLDRDTKTRFQYCKNSNDVLLHIRAEGHSGELIALELMNVAIPLRERIPVSQRKPFDCELRQGLIASGHEGRATALHSTGPFWGRSRRNIQERFIKAEESAPQQWTEASPAPSAGSRPGHKKKGCSFGRQGLTPISFTSQC